MNRFTITTPIFYVNGPPHIGHAYTVVAADVLARAHRLGGDDPTSPRGASRFTGLRGAGVFFLTGTDEHGTKIAEAAATAGQEPPAFANQIADRFQSAWKALDIQYDDFIRTTEPRHVQGVQHALRVLHERGHLYQKSYRGLYCSGCENFLTEKDLVVEKAPLPPASRGGLAGQAPLRRGFPSRLGRAETDAGRRKCPLHNREPEIVEEKNWFFKLSAFLPEVQRRIEADELRISPAERKNEVLGLLGRSDLDGGRSDLGARPSVSDFSISRPADRVPWAIPLPFDSSQTCYVWVDALLNYVTALGFGVRPDFSPEKSGLTPFWPADVQLIGQDILKFHAVYWPALLLALGLKLPREIFVHGFFTVNGQKISKSLGNAVDPLALVSRYGSDATRFLLLSQFPFGASGDVQASRFDEQYNAILANTIGNLVSRVITLLQKFSASKIPDAPPDSGVIASEAKQSLSSPRTQGPAPVVGADAQDEAISSSVAFDLDALVREPVRLAQSLNAYADRTAPWKESDPAKRATSLRTLADGIVRLALIAEPVLPKTSTALKNAFGVVDHALPGPGTPVHPTDPPVLFPRAPS